MPFPQYPLPTDRTNDRRMRDAHPTDHNLLAAAVNDLQRQISGVSTFGGLGTAVSSIPGPVTGATVTGVGNNFVGLSWTNPTSSALAGVQVRRRTGMTAPTLTDGTLVANVLVPLTTYTDIGLAVGTAYTYALFPYTTDGVYGTAVTLPATTTSVVDTTPPEPVEELAVSGFGSTFVDLTWTNPDDAGYKGAHIRRLTGLVAPTLTTGTTVTNVLAPGHTWTDSTVTANTDYTYAAFGFDAAGNHTAAVTVTVRTAGVNDVTPPAPVSNVAEISTTVDLIAFNWTNPLDSDFKGVKIRRATGAIAPTLTTGTQVGDVAKPGFAWMDGPLTANTRYTYSLFSYDTSGNHAARATYSATTLPGAVDTTPPGPVTSLAEINTGPRHTAFNWVNPADGDFAGVHIRRLIGTTAPTLTNGDEVRLLLEEPATAWIDGDRTPSTTYTYGVWAVDDAGNRSTRASLTLTTKVDDGTDVTPPGPVTALASGGVGQNYVAFNWTNPIDADFAGVMIRRATGSTPPASTTAGTLVTSTGPTATAWIDGSDSPAGAPAPNTTYSYSLFAFDAVPNYSPRASITLTTLATTGDVTPPGPVTSLGALPGETSVGLGWTNPVDADFAGVRIRRANGATAPATVTAGTQAADLPAGVTSYNNTGLVENTQYSYSIFAKDEVPNWSVKTSTTVTTLGSDPPPPPGPGIWTDVMSLSLPVPQYIIDRANSSWGAPDVGHNQDSNDWPVSVLVGALYGQRTSNSAMITKVKAALELAVGTDGGARALGIGRKMPAVVIAANIVNHHTTRFDNWLKTAIVDGTREGHGHTGPLGTATSVRETAAQSPANWGGMCRGLVAAIAVHTGWVALAQDVARWHLRYLGINNGYEGLAWKRVSGDPCGYSNWHINGCGTKYGVNPPGSVRDGHDFSLIMPEDQRRGGSYNGSWPPVVENYVRGMMGALLIGDVIMTRAGLIPPRAANNAVKRGSTFAIYSGEGSDDDLWQKPILRNLYGATGPNYAGPAGEGIGKPMAFTDWTHGP